MIETTISMISNIIIRHF